MITRGLPAAPLLVAGLLALTPACHRAEHTRGEASTREDEKMAVHFVEIVTNDLEALVGMYERVHGLSFGAPDPDLGQARVATWPDGTLLGVRVPLAAHEVPIMRTYLVVEDIQQAVKQAEENGAVVAYGPTKQGQRGTFAILFHGEVQHGLWQQ